MRYFEGNVRYGDTEERRDPRSNGRRDGQGNTSRLVAQLRAAQPWPRVALISVLAAPTGRGRPGREPGCGSHAQDDPITLPTLPPLPLPTDPTLPLPTDPPTDPPTTDTTLPPTSDTTAPPTTDTTEPPTSDTTAPPTSDTTAPPTSGTTAPPTSGTTEPATVGSHGTTPTSRHGVVVAGNGGSENGPPSSATAECTHRTGTPRVLGGPWADLRQRFRRQHAHAQRPLRRPTAAVPPERSTRRRARRSARDADLEEPGRGDSGGDAKCCCGRGDRPRGRNRSRHP